ncbi:MAG: hypothetical protein Q9226_005804 [Calogaya cf. arnoldii]
MIYDHDLDLLWAFLIIGASAYTPSVILHLGHGILRAVWVIPFTIGFPGVDDAVTSSTGSAIVRSSAQLRANRGSVDTFLHAWDTGVVPREVAIGMAYALLTKRLEILL